MVLESRPIACLSKQNRPRMVPRGLVQRTQSISVESAWQIQLSLRMNHSRELEGSKHHEVLRDMSDSITNACR